MKKIVFLIFIILIIIIGSLVFFKPSFLQNQKIVEEITPTPTIIDDFPTEAPATPTPSIVEPTKSISFDKTIGLDRADLSVEVQNGSGQKFAGTNASEILKGLGYHITSIKNANSFEYEGVTIKLKEDKIKYIDLVKKDLESNYSIATFSANLATSSAVDVVVIVGK